MTLVHCNHLVTLVHQILCSLIEYLSSTEAAVWKEAPITKDTQKSLSLRRLARISVSAGLRGYIPFLVGREGTARVHERKRQARC